MTLPSRREIETAIDDLGPDDMAPEERFRTALWASLKNYYDGPLSAEERRALSWYDDDTTSEGEIEEWPAPTEPEKSGASEPEP